MVIQSTKSIGPSCRSGFPLTRRRTRSARPERTIRPLRSGKLRWPLSSPENNNTPSVLRTSSQLVSVVRRLIEGTPAGVVPLWATGLAFDLGT